MQIEQIAKEAHNELVTNIYAGHTEPFTPWLLEFAKLVAAKERELCKKECMEQFELSLSANEKAKRAKDKEAYLNSAIGAKYCLMRIDARGEA